MKNKTIYQVTDDDGANAIVVAEDRDHALVLVYFAYTDVEMTSINPVVTKLGVVTTDVFDKVDHGIICAAAWAV